MVREEDSISLGGTRVGRKGNGRPCEVLGGVSGVENLVVGLGPEPEIHLGHLLLESRNN